MITQDLQYVEILSEQVLIDSRVYCREILQVDHSDWMQNTFKKHRDKIESRFGKVIVRDVMTDVITNTITVLETVTVNVATKYLLMTEKQCNAFLVFSSNRGSIPEKKLDLVADFDRANQLVRQLLERQFQKSLATTQQQPEYLTKECLLSLLESSESHPVKLDDIWMHLGCTKKDNITRILSVYFLYHLDYQSYKENDESVVTFSLDGFKTLCSLLATTESHKIRKRLITLEKEYRQSLETFQPIQQVDADATQKENKTLKTLLDALQEQVTVLTLESIEQKKQYKFIYDKMQHFQAKAMANAMLDRLQNTPEHFTETEEMVFLISGIANLSYFRSRCKEDLEYKVDYLFDNKKLKFTPHAALQMILNFRSKRGVASKYVPDSAELNIKKLLKGQTSGKEKTNRRSAQPLD